MEPVAALKESEMTDLLKFSINVSAGLLSARLKPVSGAVMTLMMLNPFDSGLLVNEVVKSFPPRLGARFKIGRVSFAVKAGDSKV